MIFSTFKYAFLNAINYMSHAEVQKNICKIKKSVMFKICTALQICASDNVAGRALSLLPLPALDLLEPCCRAGASKLAGVQHR